MSGERLMPDGTAGPEITTGAPPIETSLAIPPKTLKEELGLDFDPTEEAEIVRDYRRKRELQDALEREGLEKARAREREYARSGISRKEKQAQMAERFGYPAEAKKDFKYEWIHSQQLGEIPVEWPKTQDIAEKHIKDVLGRIEIAQASITQQMQVDYQNAQSVLEVLEVRESDEDENGIAFTQKQIENQQKWAAKMRLEMKARYELHQAFFKYENGSSIKNVQEAMMGLDSGWMDVIFGLEEKIPETGEVFNPFVKALQYYEDHGHEFARHNIRGLRTVFGEKVQVHILDFVARKSLGIDPDKKELTQDEQVKIAKFIQGKEKTYQWAQNMAERLFRSTGRAIMYDYLVINKDKPNERMVTLDYTPVGDERIEWAGGRDGCDYPMSKIYRFRENMKTSSEGGLQRGHIELLDGVDLFAGDFWTRTIRKDYIAISKTIPKSPESLYTIRITKDDFESKVKDRVEDFMARDKLTRERAEVAAREFLLTKFSVIDKPNFSTIADSKERQRAEEYYYADIYSDRQTANNSGELVRHIDFSRMERKLDENGNVTEGIKFTDMGDTPFSLWGSRMLSGPGGVLDKLTGDRETFLLNPTFQSLGKLINEFDYSKGNAWKVKEQLLVNFIKYARGEIGDIEGTGKRRLSEDDILAGINQLTGFTDENAPQFVQPQERVRILADYFNIKLSDRKIRSLKKQAEREAEIEINVKYPSMSKEEKEIAIKALAEKKAGIKINKRLNNKIEGRINRKFIASFGGWFLWGAIKGGLKQALAELGIK